MNKIFVITLPNSSRINTVINGFKKYNIEIIPFYGVNGRTEDLSKYNIDRTPKQRFWHNAISCCSYNHKLTDLEYACSLSHIKVYEHMVANRIKLAIICEDDVIPTDTKFVDIYNNLESIQKQVGFELLFFRYIDKINSPFAKKIKINNIEFQKLGIDNLNWLINRRKTCYLACSYALTLDGAKKLLSKAYPVRMVADRLTGLIAYNKLNAWKTIPMILDETNAPSTLIHYTGN